MFRKGSWDFRRDCTESIGQFGSIAILIMLSPLLHEHEISFHLFRFSLILSVVFRGFQGTILEYLLLNLFLGILCMALGMGVFLFFFFVILFWLFIASVQNCNRFFYIDHFPPHPVDLFLSSSSFLVDSLRFSICKIMSYARDNFTFFFFFLSLGSSYFFLLPNWSG